DLHLMLDGERLDLDDVASPPIYHAAAIQASLEAGAHVLVEKPLCLDVAIFDRLAELADSKALCLMCVHNWKCSPQHLKAAELIAQGRIGAVRHVAMRRLRTQHAGGAPWRVDSSAGG